uniref:Uncharacterized protein n=1 Tax=Fagus sylvatica TaxID=28930 RepID=A0A2N9HTV9_FAGSY
MEGEDMGEVVAVHFLEKRGLMLQCAANCSTDPHSPPPPAPRLTYTRFPPKKNSGGTSAHPRGPPSTTHAFTTSFPRSLVATALFSPTHFQPSITALLILTVRSSIPLSTELISAVDVRYKDELIFSKVQETEAETGWFLCSPFRVDLLGQKESNPDTDTTRRRERSLA